MMPPQPVARGKFCSACHNTYEAAVKFCPRDGTLLLSTENALAGKFILGRELGAGGMGVVYQALQIPMGRTVAVKLLQKDLTRNEEALGRFEREARAASSFSHPNTVTIYDSGRTGDGHAYLAMEYLEGEDLAKVLARETRLFPRRALELWLPVVDAMAAAHDKGVVHRDLKPENIFISRQQSQGQVKEQVKLLDFGIAKMLQGNSQLRQTRPNTVMGTLQYMAPEQLAGKEASPSSDVYALGLILCEMLTGQLPWPPGESSTLLTVHRMMHPPLPLRELYSAQSFSPDLQQLLDAILALDSRQRPADAGELLDLIQRHPIPEALPPATDVTPVDSPQPGSPTLPMQTVASPPQGDTAQLPLPQGDTAQLPLPQGDTAQLPLPQDQVTPVTVTAPPVVGEETLPLLPSVVGEETLPLLPSVVGEETLPLLQPAWHPDATTAQVSSPSVREGFTAEMSARWYIGKKRPGWLLVAGVSFACALLAVLLLKGSHAPVMPQTTPSAALPHKAPARSRTAPLPAAPVEEPPTHLRKKARPPSGRLHLPGSPPMAGH